MTLSCKVSETFILFFLTLQINDNIVPADSLQSHSGAVATSHRQGSPFSAHSTRSDVTNLSQATQAPPRAVTCARASLLGGGCCCCRHVMTRALRLHQDGPVQEGGVGWAGEGMLRPRLGRRRNAALHHEHLRPGIGRVGPGMGHV